MRKCVLCCYWWCWSLIFCVVSNFSFYFAIVFALICIVPCQCHCVRFGAVLPRQRYASQYFTFTHNLRKLIRSETRNESILQCHTKFNPFALFYPTNFKIRGTFDPTISHALTEVHTHTYIYIYMQQKWGMYTSPKLPNMYIQTINEDNLASRSADDKNNINLLLHKFESDFKYGSTEFKWNIFVFLFSRKCRRFFETFATFSVFVRRWAAIQCVRVYVYNFMRRETIYTCAWFWSTQPHPTVTRFQRLMTMIKH